MPRSKKPLEPNEGKRGNQSLSDDDDLLDEEGDTGDNEDEKDEEEGDIETE